MMIVLHCKFKYGTIHHLALIQYLDGTDFTRSLHSILASTVCLCVPMTTQYLEVVDFYNISVQYFWVLNVFYV